MIEELKQIRGILDRLTRLGAEPYIGNSIGNVMACEALVTLDKLIAEQASKQEAGVCTSPMSDNAVCLSESGESERQASKQAATQQPEVVKAVVFAASDDSLTALGCEEWRRRSDERLKKYALESRRKVEPEALTLTEVATGQESDGQPDDSPELELVSCDCHLLKTRCHKAEVSGEAACKIFKRKHGRESSHQLHSPTDQPITLTEEERREAVEVMMAGIIDNRRHGLAGEIDPNWQPSNYEWGNIQAEAESALTTLLEWLNRRAPVKQEVDEADMKELIDDALVKVHLEGGSAVCAVYDALEPYLRPAAKQIDAPQVGGDLVIELMEAAKEIQPHIRLYGSSKKPRRRLKAALATLQAPHAPVGKDGEDGVNE